MRTFIYSTDIKDYDLNEIIDALIDNIDREATKDEALFDLYSAIKGRAVQFSPTAYAIVELTEAQIRSLSSYNNNYAAQLIGRNYLLNKYL